MWLAKERREGTLLAEETLWREAYCAHSRAQRATGGNGTGPDWPCVASEIVFQSPGNPLDQRAAGTAACDFLMGHRGLDRWEQARKMQEIADEHGVEAWKLRGLLAPGGGYPWMFPRRLWTEEVISENLESILACFEWKGGSEPRSGWLRQEALYLRATEFLMRLRSMSIPESPVDRMLAALASLMEQTVREGKDPGTIESHSFVNSLSAHGLSGEEVSRWYSELLNLRDMILMLDSFGLYRRAESLVSAAEDVRSADPRRGLDLLTRAAGIYKRLCVAQMYPEPLLDRYHRISRLVEEVRREAGLPPEGCEHLLLVSTMNSPGDLQRLLLSVGDELKSFGYGGKIHVVVSDESSGDMCRETERILDEAKKSGMSVSHWTLDRRHDLLDRLNKEVFPGGDFDVRRLAGVKRPGEKGVPYGRLRNFLRLAALLEIREHNLEEPISTWLDQDNELGALVLTRAGTLSKRHAFNYFEQKSSIFDDPKIRVGGGGYTNDALEGVERFWVAWGILHNTLALVENQSAQASCILPARADITRFRPWDQPDTLERLPREGEHLETMSDQILLLLKTLLGTFRGKYDNQVQVYHPWSFGFVSPEDESLVEEVRPFAGMPGGNTSFRSDILSGPLPFINVAGRGEDIFHLWQVEATYGPGSVCLTHTPVLHTRNVRRGRGDLMAEIIDSFNGRIFREPPYLWAAMDQFFNCGRVERALPGQAVEAETWARIDGLRGEAKSSIAAVSGFAAELEPHLDEEKPMLAMGKAKNAAAFGELIGEIGAVIQDFKDVEKHHGQAEENLLGFEDVKELTAEYLEAFPRWQRIVEHAAGMRAEQPEQVTGLAAGGPSEGYGARLRETTASSAAFARGPSAIEDPALVEPMDEPLWREVVTSALLVFRRSEQGSAQRDEPLEWSQRVSGLSRIYDHYVSAQPTQMPDYAWTELFRDALLIPYSAPYLAVNEMLRGEFLSVGAREKDESIEQLARRFDVETELLRQALTPAAKTGQL